MKGSCLCGAIAYSISGAIIGINYCHCTQCRKTSGHFVAATACDPGDLELTADESLRWYRSSAKAERGFCGTCGSSLFWRPTNDGHISIMAGTLDAPTGLEAVKHIFVANASDYYTIDDGLPQHPGGSPLEAPA